MTAWLDHSLILASDHRVPDATLAMPLLRRRHEALAALGAHHVLVFTAGPDRVLVVMAFRAREPVLELLRSAATFGWFDELGVADLPGVFAGELVEHLTPRPLADADARTPGAAMLAAIVPVDDAEELVAELRAAHAELRGAGVRHLWVFHAVDDPGELLLLHQVEDERAARRWLARPGVASAWLAHAGTAPYPPVFVGRLAGVLGTGPG